MQWNWRSNAAVVPSVLILLLSAGRIAATPMEGWVNMEGSIIDAVCAIDVGGRDQTINMPSLPISQIIRDGHGTSQPFAIRLVDCRLERSDWKKFQVTFDGVRDGEGFGVDGEARGVALRITDSRGIVAVPGSPLPVSDVIPDDMVLNYSLDVVGNKEILRAGDYRSTMSFKMEYY